MVRHRFYRFIGLLSAIALIVTAIVVPGPADTASAGDLGPGGTFTDDDGNTHEGMIEAIVAEGITLGCNVDGTLYCPADNVRRDQMASFLKRALGLPDSVTDWFSDDNGNTHEGAINSIADAGVTLGFPDGTYDPAGLVSREQMASFLKRALGLPDGVDDGSFTDVTGGPHVLSIYSIRDAGITVGCNAEGTLYCPGENVRRDQMASFLGRGLGLDPIFPPPPTTTTSTLVPDTESPTWPGGASLTVSGMSDVTVVLDWTANPATDNVGVTGYDVYVDGVHDQTVAGTTATVLGLTPSTMYTMRVEARDAAGNVTTDGPSADATTDATPDTEAPTWSGGSIMVTSKTDTTLNVSWSGATDNVGVFEYNVYVDDVWDQTVSGTSATVSGLTASTSYTVRVEATDAAGNESTDGPDVTDTTDDPPDTEAPTWAGGSIMETGTTETSISVSWSGATDNVGVVDYRVYVDDVLDQTVGGTSATVTGLTENTTYTIRVEARDAAGNESDDGPDDMFTTDAAAATETITLTNFVFTDANAMVSVGTEVTFDNVQGNHDLIWESGPYPGEAPASTGWSVTFTADTAGTFDYYCSVHGSPGSGMAGTLTVNP